MYAGRQLFAQRAWLLPERCDEAHQDEARTDANHERRNGPARPP
jgi:hypothetical protein